MADNDEALARQVGGAHYKSMRIQPIEFGMLNGLNPCQMLAMRYLTRSKGGLAKRIEDRRKAIHCIELELQFLEMDAALPVEERVSLRRTLIEKIEGEIKEITSGK